MFSNLFFSFENRAVYEIMLKKYCTARQVTDDNAIRRMRIAFWIPKATHTDTAYAILPAFPLQKWFQERASMLRYTYTTCLLKIIRM